MAWRDSRKNRPRLFLFISSIIFGIAALVAIYSFGYDLRRSIDDQAATLIGADLSVSSNKPIDKKAQPFLDSLGSNRSQELSFVSMVLFPKNKGTRLVQVRALQGRFPYYGDLETTPATAGKPGHPPVWHPSCSSPCNIWNRQGWPEPAAGLNTPFTTNTPKAPM